MSLPGFTAEASLDSSVETFQGHRLRLSPRASRASRLRLSPRASRLRLSPRASVLAMASPWDWGSWLEWLKAREGLPPSGLDPEPEDFWDWFQRYWKWREGLGPRPEPWVEPPIEPPIEPPPISPPIAPPGVPWWQYGGWLLIDLLALAYLGHQLYIASEKGGTS